MATFVLKEKAKQSAVKDDPTRQALVRALQCYDSGQYKAVIAHGANALNLIAAAHDLNGGGWS